MPTRNVTIPQFVRVLADLNPKLRRHIVRGLQSAGARLVGLVVEEIDHADPHPAVDTAGLRQSVGEQKVSDGAIVSVSAPHAGAIEHGTRPFFPPVAPLAAWALRKGLAQNEQEARSIGFLIARKISRTGIAPRHYFAKAWARFPVALHEELRAELEAASREP